MEIDLKDYLPKDIIPKNGNIKLLIIDVKEDKLILNARNCSKEIILNRFIDLDNEDLIAIGVYLAEGYKKVNFNKKTHHSGEIGLANSELNCCEVFCKFIEKLGIKRTEFKIKVDLNINVRDKIDEKKVLDFWINNLKLSKECLRPNFIFNYTGTKGKKIPTCTGNFGCIHLAYASVIFRSCFIHLINKIFMDNINSGNKREIALILKGFFAGDGHVEYSEKPRRKGLYFSNDDKEFIKTLIKALNVLGVYSYFVAGSGDTKTNSQSLIVSKYEYMKIIIDSGITNFINYKREKAQKLINSYKITNGRFSNKLRVSATDEI